MGFPNSYHSLSYNPHFVSQLIMVVSKDVKLPSDEELTVQEVNVSTAGLRAASFHLGKACENENNEFMLCRTEEGDPRKCLAEGRAVTACSLSFFRQIKKSCARNSPSLPTALTAPALTTALNRVGIPRLPLINVL